MKWKSRKEFRTNTKMKGRECRGKEVKGGGEGRLQVMGGMTGGGECMGRVRLSFTSTSCVHASTALRLVARRGAFCRRVGLQGRSRAIATPSKSPKAGRRQLQPHEGWVAEKKDSKARYH